MQFNTNLMSLYSTEKQTVHFSQKKYYGNFFPFYSGDIMRSSWDLLLALYFEPKVANPKGQSEF
jgi:hypothetical protein